MKKTDSYPECFFGSVVSPGEFWLVSKLSVHAKEVKKVEQAMSEEFNRVLTLPSSTSLERNKCVAVENPTIRGLWQRGKIINKVCENIYEVLLIDCGYISEFDIKNIQILMNHKYTEVEPLAFKLCLYGIVPCSSNESQTMVLGKWSSSASDFVHDLFSKRLLIYAEKHHISKRVVFGDILFIDRPDGELTSLSKLLLKKKYSVYSEPYYNEEVIDPGLLKQTKSDSVEKFGSNSPSQCYSRDNMEDLQSASLNSEADFSQYGSNDTFCKLSSNWKANSSCNEAKADSCHETSIQSSSGSSINVKSGKSTRKFSSCFERHSISKKRKGFYLDIQDQDNTCQPNKNVCDNEVFTLFLDSTIRPTHEFRKLNISSGISLNLEKEGHFKHLSPIQKWAIPSVLKRRNMVIIGSPRTGKTLSYIIPLIELICTKFTAEQGSNENGPTAIVVCSGYESCEFICNAFQILSRGVCEKKRPGQNLRVYSIYGHCREKEAWIQLTNGCDVLISTPQSLVRLFKERVIRNLQALKFLILDDIHIITQQPSLTSVNKICRETQLSKYCQVIMCGGKWTTELAKLSKAYLKNYGLVFGSFLEASCYVKLKPVLIFVENKKKPQALLDIITQKIGKYKILIACEETCEVLFLNDILSKNGHTPLIAHSGIRIHEMKAEFHKRWRDSEGILICTDDIISDLNINVIEMLVHYTLPYRTKTSFEKRFCTLAGSFQKCLTGGANIRDICVVILLDDENHYQLPFIVRYVARLGGKVPPEVRNVCDKIEKQIELGKKDVPLCSDILEFGMCARKGKCTGRHALIKEIDSPRSVQNGLVRFKILRVHSPCFWSVRLMDFTDTANLRQTIEDLSEKISEEIKKHYENEENRKILGSITFGVLCGVQMGQSTDKVFHRARIVDSKKNLKKKPMKVMVKLIDNGNLCLVSVRHLYELPRILMEYPPQAIDVYLCNLLPIDLDCHWSEEDIIFARENFSVELNDNQFWIGKIQLSLNRSLHLDPVKLCTMLENISADVMDFSARDLLLSKKIAVNNQKHLIKLFSLLQESDMEIPAFKYAEAYEASGRVDPQWAFFDEDTVKVQYLFAQSTSRIFLRMAKFNTLLLNLEEDCQREGNEMIIDGDKMCISPFESKNKGVYCLARHENFWYRARIESLQDGRAQVFCIDRGVFHLTKEILPISEKLLYQLPAQAIECSLAGVKEGSATTENILKEINRFFSKGADDLYVKIMGNNMKPDVSGGRKYEINLGKSGVSLNKILIESGLVERGDVMVDDFQFVQSCNETVKIAESSKDLVSDETQDVPDFKNMTSDIYEDENAEFFLKDFMEHFMPDNVTEKEEPEISEELEPVETEKLENLKEATTKTSAITYKMLSQEVLTPEILWSQNESTICLKINLTNVQKYKLDCSINSLIFRCLLNGKLYAFSLKLFGSINPEMTDIRVKTFFVVIVIQKLCMLPWPRLSRDNSKRGWIKRDADSYIDKVPTGDIHVNDTANVDLAKRKTVSDLDSLLSSETEEDSLSDTEDEEFNTF